MKKLNFRTRNVDLNKPLQIFIGEHEEDFIFDEEENFFPDEVFLLAKT
jgi:hypothetical protein